MANPPFPKTLKQVITGSKRTYRAKITELIAELNPKWFSNMGNMTKMPPPGTAATENLAMTK
jgi:hypothetical protein